MAAKRVSDYELLLQINSAVARIENKYDKKFSDIEDDIDELQKFQNKALGILAFAGTIIPLATTYIWNKVVGR